MVAVVAIEGLDMQRHAGVHRERLEPLPHQVGIELADLVAREVDLEHQHRPARNVERDARQRLVHRHVDAGIAVDAGHVAERLLHGLAERDADVLGGVVMVDVQVADRLHRDVDAGMAGQQIEHMVEEADTGRSAAHTRPIEVDRDLDVGLLGLALDRRLAHALPLGSRRPKTRLLTGRAPLLRDDV